MTPEIEAKWLDIDHDEIRAKLIKLGAKQTRPKTDMTRATFEDVTGEMNRKRQWVRVRNEGDQTTMSLKRTLDDSICGTHEVCLNVDNFDMAVDFLKQIGLVQKAFQETRRESWVLDGAEIDLDEWPWIPPFIEIEAASEEKVQNVVEKLGLKMADGHPGAVDVIYPIYYDVTPADVDKWPEARFTENVPEWLEKKRRAK